VFLGISLSLFIIFEVLLSEFIVWLNVESLSDEDSRFVCRVILLRVMLIQSGCLSSGLDVV